MPRGGARPGAGRKPGSKNRPGLQPPIMRDLFCAAVWCQKELEGTTGKRRYCSPRCAARARNGWRPSWERECVKCGAHFVATGTGRAKRYCSVPCRSRAGHARRTGPLREISCQICGASRLTTRASALTCGSRGCLLKMQAAILAAKKDTGMRRRDIPDELLLAYSELVQVRREISTWLS